jgi:hypothetical protein
MYGIFSCIIMILLLNSLIAVISDSYESCLLRSKRLFGRARIQFLGDTLAFQNLFVKSSVVEEQHWSHGGFTLLLYAGFLLFELLVINTKPMMISIHWMYGSFALNAYITICFNVILAQQVQARAGHKVNCRYLHKNILFAPQYYSMGYLVVTGYKPILYRFQRRTRRMECASFILER